MWIARNKNGTLKLVNSKPYRKENFGEWFIGREFESDYLLVDSSLFPELKWEDEPIEVEIVSKNFMDILRKKNEVMIKMFEIENEENFNISSDVVDTVDEELFNLI